MWAIRNQFLQVQSFSTIAKNFKLSVPTVISIFEKMVKVGRSPLTKCICIDEFKFKITKYNKFPCVISDFESEKILDMIELRKEAYLSRYFNSLNQVEINTVKYFVSDLNEAYRTIR